MNEKLGLLHIYCGDGKGKTTAAMGLALRALGCNYRVMIVQFLKDGDSHELKAFKTFSQAQILSGKSVKGFTFTMNDSQKDILTQEITERFNHVVSQCANGECDVVILDEILDAIHCGFLDWDLFYHWVKHRPASIEVVVTGRNPSAELLELADYVTEMKKVKHPYDLGIAARKGVEF